MNLCDEMFSIRSYEKWFKISKCLFLGHLFLFIFISFLFLSDGIDHINRSEHFSENLDSEKVMLYNIARSMFTNTVIMAMAVLMVGVIGAVKENGFLLLTSTTLQLYLVLIYVTSHRPEKGPFSTCLCCSSLVSILYTWMVQKWTELRTDELLYETI
ncbi:hypothetical protein HDE_11763 [Halotydeus destructor]|nr:hypothetical protein HDE_11763 [Halotydeus destructor]